MKIKSTNWGLAYRVGKDIEINPVLKQYPVLYNKILQHEKQHKPNTTIDFWHDFKSIFLFNKESFKFFLEHPIISIESILPIWLENSQIKYNSFLCIIYLLFIIIGLLLGQFFGKFIF